MILIALVLVFTVEHFRLNIEIEGLLKSFLVLDVETQTVKWFFSLCLVRVVSFKRFDLVDCNTTECTFDQLFQLRIAVLDVVKQDTEEIVCVLLLLNINRLSSFELKHLSECSWCITKLLRLLQVCKYVSQFDNDTVMNEAFKVD